MIVLALGAFAHRASAQDFRVKVTLPGGNRLPIALDTIGAPYELDFPKSKVFSAFSEAFTDLEIPIENRDYSLGVIGNATLQIRAFFAGSQLSRYAECGLGATGPNANSWKVHMAVIAFIDSIGPTKTRVRVAMTAGAADPAGATKESTMCGTTGVLEDKLSARAAKRLQ
jgi:hypothetical protein